MPIARSRPGIASATSIIHIQDRVDDAAEESRDRTDHQADRETDADGDEADQRQ